MDRDRTLVEECITDPVIDTAANIGKKIVAAPFEIAAGAAKWAIGGIIGVIRGAIMNLPIFPVKK